MLIIIHVRLAESSRQNGEDVFSYIQVSHQVVLVHSSNLNPKVCLCVSSTASFTRHLSLNANEQHE